LAALRPFPARARRAPVGNRNITLRAGNSGSINATQATLIVSGLVAFSEVYDRTIDAELSASAAADKIYQPTNTATLDLTGAGSAAATRPTTSPLPAPLQPASPPKRSLSMSSRSTNQEPH